MGGSLKLAHMRGSVSKLLPVRQFLGVSLLSVFFFEISQPWRKLSTFC